MPSPSIFVQERVDILLGVDMVRLAASGRLSHVVLVTGDGGFVPALQVVKQFGVVTVLWHGPRRSRRGSSVHDELWDACDERHETTKDLLDQVRLV